VASGEDPTPASTIGDELQMEKLLPFGSGLHVGDELGQSAAVWQMTPAHVVGVHEIAMESPVCSTQQSSPPQSSGPSQAAVTPTSHVANGSGQVNMMVVGPVGWTQQICAVLHSDAPQAVPRAASGPASGGPPVSPFPPQPMRREAASRQRRRFMAHLISSIRV